MQNDILQYKKFFHGDFFYNFYNVTTKQEFIDTLYIIEKKMTKGEVFTLHLETHGSESGIRFSSDECITWEFFFECIRPINIKMGHNLILIMAMCKGGAIISHIEPDKRAPYKAFIGTYRIITQDEVCRGFHAFYENYSNMLDIVEGMRALDLEIDGVDPKKKTFWCQTAESIFDSTFNLDRDSDFFKEMVTKHYNNHIANGEMHITWEQVEKKIIKIFKDTSDRCRDFFCFKDIYKKHE